jgi:hypothetical protein
MKVALLRGGTFHISNVQQLCFKHGTAVEGGRSPNKQLSQLHLTRAPYFENALEQNINRAILEAISD